MGKKESIWEYSREGRQGVALPSFDVPTTPLPGEFEREERAALPEVSELDTVRHFTRLSRLNFSIDTNFYPLGSCTMKYNPKVNEKAASLSGFAAAHPLQGEEFSQGALEIMYKLQEMLGEISGLPQVSLQPAAGAHGELAGLLMIRAYQRERGELYRTKILIPDSAHGTNPATVTMAGFEAVEIPSNEKGNIDLDRLRELCDNTVAGLMVTNPNTLGLFEETIAEATEAVHNCGGLVYGDGANLNAIMGVLKPGELGIDILHFNLHKTFSTPHGGGGPGAGPVAVREFLGDYLPGFVAEREKEHYRLSSPPKSIGSLKTFYGNFSILLRAYTYIAMLGAEGIKECAEVAVLNANYLKALLKEKFTLTFDGICMHEFVISGKLPNHIGALDIAKRLIDLGFHPPTIYFPLIVPEALMIEPTETESRETLEAFAAAMIQILKEAEESPELLKAAPHTSPIGRIDETAAARKPVLKEETR